MSGGPTETFDDYTIEGYTVIRNLVGLQAVSY